ncbi:acyl-CoA dehydrogenase family protein [Actinoplanes sp. RD1]|uniref:acyl-CoA dehydrogenase family protein n=1 Tax=Actinoplanes sp. RD1 TaxID=3064538 RepID=UPI002740905E|nr:acyl-CoA dehydrogenase family protein [Actinoplanes sp. RD1]
MAEQRQEYESLLAGAVGDRAAHWDVQGSLPVAMLRELGTKGLLCGQVPQRYGGLGLSSGANGELTAYAGSLCGSLRSVMTSQGMAAWTVQRLGTAPQRAAHLAQLTSGRLAGVAFSEPGAGSDLAAMTTTITDDGAHVRLDGRKTWITVAAYADLLVVFGRYGDEAAAVVVPADAPGVRIERIPAPLGCRAAGHADVDFDGVRLPRDAVLGGTALPLGLIATTALTSGRVSVAWGCVGILRSCLREAVRHATQRRQGGTLLADHQLIRRHLAELTVAEQAATRLCEHASACWDAGTAELVSAAVLAKHFAATRAAAGAADAVQVLASAGSRDGHPVARAYRDAKLMELIEGSNEISQMMLADRAVAVWS